MHGFNDQIQKEPRPGNMSIDQKYIFSFLSNYNAYQLFQ